MLSLSPFRRLVKDYFLICESYYQAIRRRRPRHPGDRHGAARPARRGQPLLLERLKGKITVDIATARRLFTLLCALHWKG